MFENKLTEVQKVHYSRYIISWLNAGGSADDAYCKEFKEWLTANCLTEDEQRDVRNMMTNGKLELEENAKAYITALKTRRE